MNEKIINEVKNRVIVSIMERLHIAWKNTWLDDHSKDIAKEIADKQKIANDSLQAERESFEKIKKENKEKLGELKEEFTRLQQEVDSLKIVKKITMRNKIDTLETRMKNLQLQMDGRDRKSQDIIRNIPVFVKKVVASSNLNLCY
jgi:ethanolamine utilization cobalamin adenosyltransferase